MKNRFEHCQTQEEARTLYSKLVMEMHPDRHPSEEAAQWTELFKIEFPKLNKEFAAFVAGNVRTKERQRQEEAHAEGKRTTADYNDLDSLFEEWKKIIEAALNLGVDVELIGLWIWVSGPNTYAQREELKKLGFKWAKKKENKTLYFNDMGVKSFSRGGYSIDDIRNMHGSTKYTKRTNSHQDEETTPAPIPATV